MKSEGLEGKKTQVREYLAELNDIRIVVYLEASLQISLR